VTRPPDRLPLDGDGRLACPRTGPSLPSDCCGCPFLQGTLESEHVEVLCAFRWGTSVFKREAATG
jgi:hypothetical protein